MGLLIGLLVHILILAVILYLIFNYLLPLIPDATLRLFVQIIVVLIAILSFLRYLPAPYGLPW